MLAIKKEAAAIYSAKVINSNNYHPTLQSNNGKEKKKKFGGQSVKSEFLPRKKNIEGFHYSKVRALKQHLKCYPAVQDHENL